MKKKIYLIRHGETELNRLHIVQGSGVDSSLNDTGRGQGRAFYNCYKDIDFQLVMTSALKRTSETVADFIEAKIPWETYPELNEMGWGIHEGKSGQPWMKDEYERVNSAWSSGDFSARMEEGESAAELAERLSKFVEILKKRPEERILICSHGRSISALMCLLKGWSLTEMKQFKSHNTALYIGNFDGEKFEFEVESDRSHLGK